MFKFCLKRSLMFAIIEAYFLVSKKIRRVLCPKKDGCVWLLC